MRAPESVYTTDIFIYFSIVAISDVKKTSKIGYVPLCILQLSYKKF